MAKKQKSKAEFPKLVGNRIASLRKSMNISQEQFAYSNGLNRTQFTRLEGGQDMRLSSLYTVILALKITPAEFFSEGFD